MFCLAVAVLQNSVLSMFYFLKMGMVIYSI
jgi:hypothetical protein